MNNKDNIYPLRIALLEPRIPQNTGNIARTCAAFKLPLDLIEPLGFSLNDKYLKRAGLDYWPYVDVNTYESLDSYLNIFSRNSRLIGCSKLGDTFVQNMDFEFGDIILLGREDSGLPEQVKLQCNKIVTINMPGISNLNGKEGVRSLNLSVATAIIAFQAGLSLKIL